ncbi:L-2-hydroxyglutarate oxidase [Vibrio tubiashii]|uniref:L-2-hydroxyglutarate oxidase n=1 Tax=Vibrio tubiashii TaxID=29498 RepID=A0AAE5LJ62_9VIBR|nr:L-2-hydroxyglutarate oxidase [Vibrio tubiashii]NOI82338.1 L-2-hydroxyglutarate oxidase [Vibrio tubiashii]
MNSFDVVIVGGGVIGLTIAKELLQRTPQLKVVVLEKETSIGKHASGRNSGVLHTGIYYPPSTMKARFCKDGAEKMFTYAQSKGVAVRRDGKVIVASSEKELKGLNMLMDNARASNVSAELIDSKRILELEPLARSEFGGLYCEDTAVVDIHGVLQNLYQDIIALGGTILFAQTVTSISSKQKRVTTLSGKSYSYNYLINAAGSYADTVGKMLGFGQDYKLVPFKGLYYRLKKEYASRVNGSIYPVPDPNLPFLGIHFTKTIDNNTYLGPTAIPALGRENYEGLSGLELSEGVTILSRLAQLYLSNTQNFRALVHKEMPHLTKSGFYSSAQKLVNELDTGWVEKSPKVGIRPQLINVRKKCLEMDFLIEKDEHSLHVLNSISPAFTSSFAVAEHIINEVAEYM